MNYIAAALIGLSGFAFGQVTIAGPFDLVTAAETDEGILVTAQADISPVSKRAKPRSERDETKSANTEWRRGAGAYLSGDPGGQILQLPGEDIEIAPTGLQFPF